MYNLRKLFWMLLILAAFVLGACSLRSSKSPTSPVANPAATYTAAAKTVSAQLNQGQGGMNATYTSVAQTVVAQLTQQALGTQIVPPPATPTLPPPTPQPTNTQVPPTATQPPPTATPVPPINTSIPIPCDRATFVKDITYPDNTEVVAGTNFVKTWRIRNNGSCTWTSGYAVVFDHLEAMNGPASQQLTTGTVAPGQEIDVSVTLKAPDATGTYQGYWKLRNSAGAVFGIGDNAQSAFWVKVKVVIPVTPTPTANIVYDFLAQAPSAEWRNAATPLPWGDPQDDTPGVAAYAENVKLENNQTYSKVLATYPQRVTDGLISGLFPTYTIQDGDHFKASLGFRANCGSASVKYRFGYKEGDTVTMTNDWIKTCDGNLLAIDINLSSLKGKTVRFILEVAANGSPDGDLSMWVSPRIER
jgi:hypothetical protein